MRGVWGNILDGMSRARLVERERDLSKGLIGVREPTIKWGRAF